LKPLTLPWPPGALLLAALLSALPAADAPAADRFLPVSETSYPTLIRQFKGSVLLVNFWATWCEPCRAELPLLVRLAQQHRSRGLKLILISVDDPEQEAQALALLSKVKAPPPYYIKRSNNDDRFIATVHPRWSGALPATFLYSRSAQLLRFWVGETDLKIIAQAVDNVLKQ
jgi:thiol-disulfide isomerase/thioredoxin